MVKRFDVYLINLDDQPSDDPKNTRPAVVISPDELNRNIETAIVAPLSATKALFPTRVPVNFLNETRYVILDQIQTVDAERLVKRIGEVENSAREALIEKLQELFAE
ncbi:MAG TPA: type II toxin-antitoxin system PemK/MazF family toxin [Pyrinomonadaceae bacterium]